MNRQGDFALILSIGALVAFVMGNQAAGLALALIAAPFLAWSVIAEERRRR